MSDVTTFLKRLLGGADVEWVPLGDIGEFIRGNGLQKKDLVDSGLPAIHYGQIYTRYGLEAHTTFSYVSEKFGSKLKKAHTNDLLLATTSENDEDVVKPVAWLGGTAAISGDMMLFRHKQDAKYLAHFILTDAFQKQKRKYITGAKVRRVSSGDLAKIIVPIPCPDDSEKSLAIQGEIVRILDKFTELTAELTAELTQRKKQYNHYRDQLLTFDEDEVEWKALGEVFNLFAGGDKPKDAFSDFETEEFNVPVLSNGIGEKSLYGWTNEAKIIEPSLTVSARGTIGWTSYRDRPIFPIIRLLVLTPKSELNLRYAYHYMKTVETSYKVPDSGIPQLTKPMIQDVPFPIPHPNDPQRSIEEQDRIAAILDKFDTLTTSLTEGLPREIELREKQYAYYRDQLLNFPKPDAGAA